ncbi:helix-turn-helix domain-containing protein [Chitinophaga agri]|nr:helix-turn-helix domain-containing protein [Chitinophaga agri]
MQMHHRELAPPEALRNTIKCFWHTRIDFGATRSDFEVMPDGYAEIVFHFGSQCLVSRNGSLQPLPSPVIMGLLNQPAILNSTGQLDVIGIRCFPWTVFDLLGLPAGKDGIRVFEHPVSALQSRLAKLVAADQIADVFSVLQQYFLHEPLRDPADSTVFKAGAVLRAGNGTTPVSRIAEAAHATVRTLERKFKQSSGHTIKDVSGLIRFEQVRNRLWLYPDENIAGLAHELGYTDQSHLSREFKRYSGTTPAAFARKIKKGK